MGSMLYNVFATHSAFLEKLSWLMVSQTHKYAAMNDLAHAFLSRLLSKVKA